MQQPAPEGSFERTLNVNGRVRLDVAIDSGLVRVTTGTDEVVQIRAILRGHHSWLGWGDVERRIRELEVNPPIEQDGNAIDVECRGDSWLAGGIALLLDIAVPKEAVVHAETDSGDIRVDGVCGPVNCRTDSGAIEISDVDSAVRARSDSGCIEILRAAGPVYAEADSGAIEALEVGGLIEAKADSGSIRLSQTVAAPIHAEADSGSIRVQLAAGAGYRLRARADSGAIRVPEMSLEHHGNEVTGQFQGGGPAVDLEVDSGDIYVE